jgi:hypothetical protein
VKYVPGLGSNLFSLTSAIKHGGKLSNRGKTTLLTQKELTILFDHHIPTKTGYIGVFLRPAKTTKISAAGLQKGTKIKASTLHGMLTSHCNNAYMRATAKELGLEVTGKLAPCDKCAIGKSQQKAVPKETDRVVTKPGELMYVDISSTKHLSLGRGVKNWIMFVDAYSDMCISRFFVQRKSSMRIVGLQVIRQLATQGIQVQTIRCDNAGEN